LSIINKLLVEFFFFSYAFGFKVGSQRFSLCLCIAFHILINGLLHLGCRRSEFLVIILSIIVKLLDNHLLPSLDKIYVKL
uniref:Ovule protein n=1 Tax=Brugia timori TaxID=42155 RepID=A0A0R3R4I6_9BILA